MRTGVSVLVAAVTILATGALADGQQAAGKIVFTEEAVPSCTVCHTLSDAGASGQIGPNLDTMKPTPERVFSAVSQGVGIMPSYEESLTEAQRRAVADYVSAITNP